MSLEDREEVVLGMLQKLPKDDAVLVGGYPLDASVPPGSPWSATSWS